MKKTGFTLIELLAVIVILAIIALIATPIIIDIVEDAEEEGEKRSMELYASAVKNAIVSYQLNNKKSPSNFNDLIIEYDGDIVCSTQQLYDDNSFYLAGCVVNEGEKEYNYGIKKDSSIEVGKLNSVCTSSSTQNFQTIEKELGHKYDCDVDPKKEGNDFSFYVISKTEKEINLIMDRNICEDGTATTSSNTCNYAWYSDSSDTSFGPITALKKLDSATSSWSNLNELEISSFYACDTSNFSNCVEKTMSESFSSYARLPYLSEVSGYSEAAKNAYLYDNLRLAICDFNSCTEEQATELGVNLMSGIDGYWLQTASTYNGNMTAPYNIDYIGHIDYLDSSNTSTRFGIRPVITLSI